MSRFDDGSLEGVSIEGPADAQGIVFVHAAVLSRAMWLPQQRALSDEFRAVAPDLPGHGTDGHDPFRMAPTVDRLEDVIASTTDGSAVLVGLSLGGYVATEYAYRYPRDVDGLVLSGCSANPVGRTEVLARAAGVLARLLTRPDVDRRALERLATRWVRNRNLPPDIESEIVDAGFAPAAAGDAVPEIAGEDFRSKLSTYPGPALVLNGEHDRVTRRGERAHAAAARDGRLEVLADAGHVCNLHRPETYASRVRRFVRRRVPQYQ